MSVNLYSYSQFTEPFKVSKVVLKSGDTLIGMGKTTNKGFKYRKSLAEKPYLIEFSKINFVQQQEFSNKEIKTFKYFQTNNDDRYIRVEEFIVGENLELYGIVSNGNVPIAGGGSFRMNSVYYYLKKAHEEKLTKIGIYDPIFSDFEDKIKDYFSDCPILLEQIEDKNLRFREGLGKMVEFYNKNCALK